MIRWSKASGTKGRTGVLAVAIMLFTAAPVFAQDNSVNVVDQEGQVINGPGIDKSSESNNNRETSQTQSSQVNDEDNRSVEVHQGGGEANATAESGETLPGVAVATATGPVASPPLTVANNDILSNKSKTTHINQSQSYEDDSEFSDDHSRTVINESFNKSPGSTVSIGRRNNSDVIVLGDREFGGKKAVSFDLVPGEKGTLPRTGAPGYTFWLLAAAMLSIVFGGFLEYSGWTGKNGLLPALADGGLPPRGSRFTFAESFGLSLAHAKALSLASTLREGAKGIEQGARSWTESVLLIRHLAPAGLAPDDSMAERADRELFVLKIAVLATALLLAWLSLSGQ